MDRALRDAELTPWAVEFLVDAKLPYLEAISLPRMQLLRHAGGLQTHYKLSATLWPEDLPSDALTINWLCLHVEFCEFAI